MPMEAQRSPLGQQQARYTDAIIIIVIIVIIAIIIIIIIIIINTIVVIVIIQGQSGYTGQQLQTRYHILIPT